MKLYQLTLSLLTLYSSHILSTEFVVVVNKSNTIDQLSKRQVIDIYMGRYLTFPDGELAQPIDLPSDSSLKNDFYLKLIDQTEQKVRAYWSRLLFSGRAKPPVEVNSLDEAIDNLRESKNSIGYIPADQVTNDIKVVYRFNED